MCFRLVLMVELRSGETAVRTLVAITTSSLGTFRFLRMVPSCISAFPAP